MVLPPLLLCLLILLFTSCSIQPASSRLKHSNYTDLESLLAFKARVTDPAGILAANWTTNTSFCMWFGIHCGRNDPRVTSIQLPNLSLQGAISPHLGNLSFLYYLDLSNNTLTGPIPKSIGQLPRLATLVLQQNFLSGPIPSTIFNMSSMIEFFIAVNNLTGNLPNCILLPRLQVISLSVNHLTGDKVISSFVQCRNLQKLSLSRNQFSGTIPYEIGNLSKLSLLYLNNNQLKGPIPSMIGNLAKLEELQLQGNNLTGSIPTTLLNISTLYFLDLSRNDLTGRVPAEIGESLPRLQWFHVGDNRLTGGLEFLSSLSSCKGLINLGIWKNELRGALPESIGNLSTSLQSFYAYQNRIEGRIPAGIGNLTGLIHLTLDENELTGKIPSEILRLEGLQFISLTKNNMSGSIPSEIGLLKNLDVLDLQVNGFSGPLPDSLANISKMEYLYLSNNKLSSSIPQGVWNLVRLLEIDLSVNDLTGPVPAQVANLKFLYWLDLSFNQFSGNISSSLGELQMISHVDLSKNSFHGQIPQSFGGMISITYLNLSHNFLSGAIPKSLADLRYLDALDLSFNKLEGPIPRGGVFSNLSISSLTGNEALCGAPQLHIPPCSATNEENNSRKKQQLLKFALSSTAFVLVLFASSYFIYTFYRRRKVKSLANNDTTFLEDSRAVSHQELVRATENFNQTNLLGIGAFGSVFKGYLDDGLLVAIKVLNLEVEGAAKSFDTECQVLRMVRHRNLVKIISVCSKPDFKALILQFMSNGSLEDWLYSETRCLNLLQRLTIMVDVSLALEYLHHSHPHLVLHCDLKPTNVLLDEEMVAHVSDFGISKLLLGHGRSITSASTPGTIGYIAPEYGSTGTVSRMGDVYSFGILLLETFTGKKPVDAAFGEESSLREWVSRREHTAIQDVVDSKMLKGYSCNKGASQIPGTMNRRLSSTIELGLLCSRYVPKERPTMTEVTARLQKIKTKYLSDYQGLEP